jgi:hypothetical protein
VLFLDQKDVVHQLFGELAGDLAHFFHRDAFGDGGAAHFGRLAVQRRMHARIHGRLDAKDLDVRLQRLGGCCDAADQAAAADRHDQRVEVRIVFQHFQRDGALPGDDVDVIERVDEGQALFFGLRQGIILGLVEVQALPARRGSRGRVCAATFVERCRLGHHDGRRNAEAAWHDSATPCAWIAGRGRDDAHASSARRTGTTAGSARRAP